MWLLKDERETLLKYYNTLQNTQECMKFIALSERTYNSTRNLINRGLLEVVGGIDQTVASIVGDSINLNNFLASSQGGIACGEITLRLTLDGYDLASKYNSWWYKTGGMWFVEHRGHWFWIVAGYIVSFLLGRLTSP